MGITEKEKAIREEKEKAIREFMTFASPKMVKLIRETEKTAGFDCPVIIEGESGTGKELLADLLQGLSERRDAPYVKVNCAAIPKELLESEIFGYEKGAFTGARETGKPGFFKLADGGTILLDEIGELPFAAQSKLLRIIQNGGGYYPIGGSREVRTDVRIIAATNRSLRDMVKKGEFRQDLYYRLAVISLKIPPLRERRADIAPLAERFVADFNKKYGTKKRITEEGMELLSSSNWPGNVRELGNFVQRLLINCEGDSAGYEDVKELGLPPEQKAKEAYRGGYNRQVEEFEKGLIEDALNKYGSTYKAAKALDMTQSQFMRKKKKFGL